MKICVIFAITLLNIENVLGLDNGLARTPPMGWLAWERFRCVTDCATYPDHCINENLFMDMADRLVEDGWKEMGYNQVNIDDCWSAKQRDNNSRLYAHPGRFPHGIKKLADYMHERGLKLGIYGDVGIETCGGYPGSLGYEKIDAQTFAEWGIDMIKFDGCYADDSQQAVGYPLMSKELNATGRPIVYSCSWPAIQGGKPPKVNYTLLGEICNLWRNYDDITDSFYEVVDIVNWWGENQDFLIPAAGPGKWNDPDMLIAGDYSLSYDESKAQFGMWAILAAPLLMSNDLRNIDFHIRRMLKNPYVIEVSQDPLGIQGRRVKNIDNIQLWVRPLVGLEQAVAVFSTRTDGTPHGYSFKMSDLGIDKPAVEYKLTDLFNPGPATTVGLNDPIHVTVNPNGIVMLRAVPFLSREEKFVIEFDIL